MSIMKAGKLPRILAALGVGCILFACFAISAMVSAQSDPKLTAAAVSAERGSTVSVTITLSDNPGLWGIKFKVGYDPSALTLSSVAGGTVFADEDVTLPESLSKQPYVYYASSSELKNITANGTVVTLKFKVAENAAFSAYPITVSLTQAVNVAGKNVPIETQNGTVTVVNCIHNKVWRTVQEPACETPGSEAEVCSKCEESFATRAIPATGHQETEVRNYRPATKTAEGYTGDTYCKDCGKLLSQGQAIPKLPEDPPPPAILQGDGAVFDKKTKSQLTFVSNVEASTLLRVEINGTVLDKKYYSVGSDNSVTISGEYLSTLADGQHTIALVSNEGTATAKFTVKTSITTTTSKSAPKTTAVSGTTQSTKPDTTKAPTQTAPGTTTANTTENTTESTSVSITEGTSESTTHTTERTSPAPAQATTQTTPDATTSSNNTPWVVVAIVIAVLAFGGLAAVIIIKRRGK